MPTPASPFSSLVSGHRKPRDILRIDILPDAKLPTCLPASHVQQQEYGLGLESLLRRIKGTGYFSLCFDLFCVTVLTGNSPSGRPTGKQRLQPRSASHPHSVDEDTPPEPTRKVACPLFLSIHIERTYRIRVNCPCAAFLYRTGWGHGGLLLSDCGFETLVDSCTVPFLPPVSTACVAAEDIAQPQPTKQSIPDSKGMISQKRWSLFVG